MSDLTLDLAPLRFRAKVRLTESCWEWTGSRSEKGYGLYYLDGKSVKAHRVAYETLVGPIPDGLQIDHLCRNPSCVNPAHMEVVTTRENTMRGNSPAAHNAKKTHCPKGHPYDEDNTVMVGGSRCCRTCRRERQRQRTQR